MSNPVQHDDWDFHFCEQTVGRTESNYNLFFIPKIEYKNIQQILFTKKTEKLGVIE